MGLKIEPSLKPFFDPKGIALIGASHNPRKLGFGLARNLIQSGYRGAIHMVNPKGGRLLQLPVYSSLREVPGPVDLAVLLIPAPYVAGAMREVGERGIRACIIASGGFREVGPEGAALEEGLKVVAGDYGIRVIGPNCVGILDTHLPMDTTFLPPPGPTSGDVAFVSHSGAICAVVIDWARGQGFGLSSLYSLGNQLDVSETDLVAPLVQDEHTKVITMYLEGVSDGRKFVDVTGQAARVKPIIALKVGRSESGQRAVASHTGALSGSETAFNAAFRRAGVIRANTSEELFDWARALAWCPPPKGRSVAVLTNSGGPGITATDALEALGLKLAVFTEETTSRLQEMLPPAASVHNPVDMLASAGPEQYAGCLGVLLEDPNVHGVIVILPPPPMYSAGGVAKTIVPTIYASEKPVVVAVMGETMIQEAVEHFRAAHIPEYRFPERAAAALAVLAQRAEYLAREPVLPVPPGDVDKEAVTELISRAAAVHDESANGFLPQEIVNPILCAYGISVPGIELAEIPDQAVEIAERTGYPVALKVASPEISHKTDIGGVLLNLATPAAVAEGFLTVTGRARCAHPEAEILGVHVQRMIPKGQEVIVGAVQDRDFGPVIMFGSGGVEVEGLKDVAFALGPLAQDEVEEMLENTWAGRKLGGYRNLPPADRPAVEDALLRLGQLAADFPQIAEIEINPLRVLAKGDGAIALDVRARLKLD